jgi:hypothetical protein
MAKLIQSDDEPQLISNTYSLVKIIVIGIGLGLLYYFLTVIIQKYIIIPVFCDSATSALSCHNSLGISGNISMVIVAVVGIMAMVMSRMTQPLIVAVATAATLWGLALWTDGLSMLEVIGWSVLSYALSYVLYSWITRYNRTVPVLILILAVIVTARIVIIL